MSSVNGVASTNTNASQTSTNPMPEVNKEEFLKLLVAQLQNQDPTSPMDNQQFVAQLATFSSLEQLISINRAVTKLTGGSTDGTNTGQSLFS